jgi:hypothetical protein
MILTSEGLEFREQGSYLFTARFVPEILEGSWKIKTASIGGLQLSHTDTLNCRDYITFTYNIETEDQLCTVTIKLGGSQKAQFGFDIEALKDSRQRVVLETDVHGFLAPPCKKCSDHENIKYILENGSMIYWKDEEKEDHSVIDETETKIAIKEGDYTKNVPKKLQPTTWSATTIAAEDTEAVGTGWESYSYVYTGYDGGLEHGGYSFTYDGSDIPSGSTISKAYISCNCGNGNNGVDMALRIQNAVGAVWAAGNLPSNASWCVSNSAASRDFTFGNDYFGEGETYATNLNSDFSTLVNDNSPLTNGDYINVCLFSGEDTLDAGFDKTDNDDAAFDIDYTAAGDGIVPLSSAYMRRRRD